MAKAEDVGNIIGITAKKANGEEGLITLINRVNPSAILNGTKGGWVVASITDISGAADGANTMITTQKTIPWGADKKTGRYQDTVEDLKEAFSNAGLGTPEIKQPSRMRKCIEWKRHHI